MADTRVALQGGSTTPDTDGTVGPHGPCGRVIGQGIESYGASVAVFMELHAQCSWVQAQLDAHDSERGPRVSVRGPSRRKKVTGAELVVSETHSWVFPDPEARTSQGTPAPG